LAPEKLSPEDFRVEADGPAFKGLGADVDLVGPGAAYENWKKTPAYQQWLQEIAQYGLSHAEQQALAEAKLQEAQRAVMTGKWLADLAAYDTTLRANPDDMATQLQRADILRRLQRYDDAVEAISQVVVKAPDAALRETALRQRALIHAERGNVQGVILDYEECLRHRAGTGAGVYGRLATCYLFGPEKVRDAKRALEYLVIALGKPDVNAGHHTLHGVCLCRLGRHREALDVLEGAFRGRDPSGEGQSAMNRFFAAMAYHNLGEAAKAQECYALAMKLPQPTPLPGLIPDWVGQMRGEAERALKIVKK